MKINKIGKVLVIIVISLTIILLIGESLLSNSIKDSPRLSDYPKSIWYSEQTGYMIEMEEKQVPGTMTVEYEEEKIPYIIFCDNKKYWIRYGVEYVGVRFETHISQDDRGTWLTLSHFSPLGKDTPESKKQTEELFGQYGEVVFQKVPKQHIIDYPDSVWKSEETGYTVTIPGKEELEERETAKVLLEYQGKNEIYEMCEDLYTAPTAMGLIYGSYDFENPSATGDSIFFSVLFLKEGDELYMKWYEFVDANNISKEEKEKNRELFMKHEEITFQKVK